MRFSDCALLPDGSCQSLVAGVLCCGLQGYVQPPLQACVIDGDDPAKTVLCLPQLPGGPGAQCAYVSKPGCYGHSTEEGIEFFLTEQSVGLIPDEFYLCDYQDQLYPACSATPDPMAGNAGASSGGAGSGSAGEAGNAGEAGSAGAGDGGAAGEAGAGEGGS